MYHDELKPINGTGWKAKKKPSSFFPDSWDQEKVLMEISHAFENKALVTGSSYRYTGYTSEKIKIEMIIREGKIETAYPIFNP